MVSCLLWNPCSLQNKLQEFISLLEDEDIHIAAITETWMTSLQNAVTAEIREKGYNIHHFVRDNKRGGGVALIYKDVFNLKNAKVHNFDTFECVVASIQSNFCNLNVVIVYRFCELNRSLFLSEFYNFLDSIYLDFSNLIILGDFNLHVNNVLDPVILKFDDILSSFNLSQLVQGPTHNLGNTLDLVIVNSNETKISDLHADFNSGSDHAYIFFKINNELKEASKTRNFVKTNYRDMNLEDFKVDLSAKVENYVETADNCFVNALTEFNSMCKDVIHDHAETKTIKTNSCARPKWMDSEFVKCRAERRRLYKCWKRTRDDIDRENYVNSRSKTHDLAFEKKSKYYTSLIHNSNNSHKELFNVCKNLLDQPRSSALPTYSSSESMANSFNNFFIDKIDKIRATFPEESTKYGYGKDTYVGPVMSEFRPVSFGELKKILLSKPIKTSPQDPIPGILLKPCLDELLPALTYLVNLSLSSGSMEGLKDSVITPLLKKAGLDPETLKNYRPVCNTAFLSKSIERTGLAQVNEHMDLIKAHIKNQSGYKPLHSCETLLVRITNDILVNIDNSKCTIMLLLDLSAAFDTVDHEVLLDILWFDLGFRGTVYNWFVEFLSNRSQSVQVDGQQSSFKKTKWGVPQGSVMGPFLFNVYIRHLIKLMEEAGFTIHGYADDHQILYSFQIDFQVAAIRQTVPRGLDLIARWMNKHFLKLNPTKSQVIIFGPKVDSSQIVFDHLLLSDGSFIKISSEVYNLGVLFDSLLTFSPHITSIVAQGYHLLRNLAGIRKYLSTDDMKSLVNAIVVAKVDNCNSLLPGISSYDLHKLQKFQNSCARLIYGKRKYDHVSGLLKELHWLPSEARIYYKVLCYVFKSIHGLAPKYLSDLINIKRAHNLSLEVPRSFTKFGDRAFSRAGPRLWNALPGDLRMIRSLDSFKAQLKHHFYSSFTQYKSNVNIYRS